MSWIQQIVSAQLANGAVTLPKLGTLTTKGDLLGFTTTHARIPVGLDNQVLTADSSQAAGVKWASAGASSPLTTKGDLYTFSTVNARLGVGTDGQTLIAASGQATGLQWGTLGVAGGGTGQTTKTAAYDALSPCTTKGDIEVHNGTNNVRKAIGTNGQELVADSTVAEGLAWKNPSYQFQFSFPGNANSATGLMGKAAVSNANPAGIFPTTTAGSPGINNGGCDPYVAINSMTINRAVLRVAHAAVGTGTFTSPATAAFDVYRNDYSTRTLIGTINFSLTSAGINNDLSGNNYATYEATGLSLALTKGDAFGVEFRPQGGNNRLINGLGGVYLALEAR